MISYGRFWNNDAGNEFLTLAVYTQILRANEFELWMSSAPWTMPCAEMNSVSSVQKDISHHN